jgi:thymidylate synthase
MIVHNLGIPTARFIWVGGDSHIYRNYFHQVQQQLIRPTLQLNPDVSCVFDMCLLDIELIGYAPHPAIKAKVAV